MQRRQFLRSSIAGCGSFYLIGCGGGSGASIANSSLGDSARSETALNQLSVAPVTPTLAGVTIDAAEAEIKSLMKKYTDWVAKRPTTYQSDVIVKSPDELNAAITAAHSDNSLALNNRIICAWDGLKSLAAGESARINVGKQGSTGHFAAGGQLRIEAASGMRPALANTMFVMGQGISISGLTFVRRALPGENVAGTSNMLLVRNSYYPLDPIVHVEKCRFGTADMFDLQPLSKFSDGSLGLDAPNWTKGICTSGTAAIFVSVSECTFRGLSIACQIVARACRFDMCDFRKLSGDAIDLFGHSFASDYFAAAWISRITIRDACDTIEFRNNHVDGIQICTPADIHKGYRLLVTDLVEHIPHSYSADPGQGGGSNAIFGSYAPETDNQFVIRRCIGLTTSPNGFHYYSPKASRPSFVDRCTFTRAGRTPSNFPGDTYKPEDFPTGIAANAVQSGALLLVTKTIARNMFAGPDAQMDLVSVDPRIGQATSVRPETIFAGRDFKRGGAPANYVADKFAYDLPNEAGTQAQFVADIWANFRNKDAASLYGIPNPTGLGWSL